MSEEHLQRQCERLQLELERLRTNIQIVITTFDNENISPTPDQRDVIDLLRQVLLRSKPRP